MQKFNEIEDTKGKIIYSAIKLIPEKGYEKTSMRQIAEEAEVTKPAVYYYFDNKKELLKELMEIGNEHVLARLQEIAESEKSFRDKMVDIILVRFRIFPDEPEVKKFISWAFTEGMKYIIEIKNFAEGEEKFRELIFSMIKSELAKGKFKEDIDIEHLFGLLLGVTDYYTKQHFLRGRPQLTEKEARDLIDILFYGIHT